MCLALRMWHHGKTLWRYAHKTPWNNRFRLSWNTHVHDKERRVSTIRMTRLIRSRPSNYTSAAAIHKRDDECSSSGHSNKTSRVMCHVALPSRWLMFSWQNFKWASKVIHCAIILSDPIYPKRFGLSYPLFPIVYGLLPSTDIQSCKITSMRWQYGIDFLIDENGILCITWVDEAHSWLNCSAEINWWYILHKVLPGPSGKSRCQSGL